jgi:hypothetical protein
MWKGAVWRRGTNVFEKRTASIFGVAFFYLEDEGNRFLYNTGTYVSNYMPSYSRRQQCSLSLL